MILADTRHHLTRDDAQLAARILSRDSGDELADLESRLADEGIDAILDDPRLPGALLRHPRGACRLPTMKFTARSRSSLETSTIRTLAAAFSCGRISETTRCG